MLAGQHLWKAQEAIVGVLRDNGSLLAFHPIRHSYPHCWRHKTPVVFRATPQWFISMDKANLRSDALAAIDTVGWFPTWGKARIQSMVDGRPDWTISRQRTWGVPIALFTHRQTGEIHPRSVELMQQVADRVEAQGIDVWYSLDAAELLGADAADYEKVTDILDVWFDSGVTHEGVLAARGFGKPADLYLEGSDQHRGWFQSSLLTGVAIDKRAPYKQCLTHGFTVDEHGRKMSKSLGNGIEPQDIMNKLGADILRLWIASADYSNEMSLSQEILKRNADAYRRLRNTARFLLGNLDGFDPAQHLQPLEQMVALDRWIVHRAWELQEKIKAAYDGYNMAEIVQLLLNFCSVDLGSLYLDVTKDRLYTMPTDSHGRRSAQSAMYHIAEAFTRWVAPILTFTADELWGYLPGERAGHVLFTTWYDGLAPLPADAQLNAADFDQLLAVREQVARCSSRCAPTARSVRRWKRRSPSPPAKSRPHAGSRWPMNCVSCSSVATCRCARRPPTRCSSAPSRPPRPRALLAPPRRRRQQRRPSRAVRPLREQRDRRRRSAELVLMAAPRPHPNALVWLLLSVAIIGLDQWSKAWCCPACRSSSRW